MVDLLIVEPGEAKLDSVAAFGGRPFATQASKFKWPTCKACAGNLEYLGRIAVSHGAITEPHLIQLFMCGNDPRMCDEGDADGGGNRALATSRSPAYECSCGQAKMLWQC